MGTHVSLSPSSAHRWMKCPGAPRLEAQMPDEGGSSVHAREGTAAHALAEECLREGLQPRHQEGAVYQVEGENIVVTQEMADAVDVFVQYVRHRAEAKDARLDLEMRVDLAPLYPPQEMRGTADAIIWQPEVRTLIVADYKHGQGVVVEVEGNVQTRYYALAAVLTLRVKPERIIITIVQPRAEHPDGPVRSEELSWQDLIAFRSELMAAAEAASDPNAPVGPVGDHCRWCRAKAICPAQRSNALVVAQSEFDDELPTAGLPAPAGLTMEQLTEVLEKSAYVEEWFNAVREHARRSLEQGEEIPGWKLVAKRAYRRWGADEETVRKWLSRRIGVNNAAPRKLISPAQAEKLVQGIPEDWIVAQSSGHNLAPESNPRPAVMPGSDAADEFEAR